MSNVLKGEKKIAIAIDDYKEQHYKKELNKRGFDNFTIGPGVTKDTRNIIIVVSEQLFEQNKETIRRLCNKLELSRPWKN